MSKLDIAVISDIHGYSLALNKVLQDIDNHSIEHIVVAGDLVESGPDPRGVLQQILDRRLIAVQGNTDYDIAKRNRDSHTATWTEKQIGRAGRRFLLDLPFEHRITPPGADSPWQDLLVVHANPWDFSRPLMPTAPDLEVGMILGKIKAGVIAFGHIHIAYQREFGGMQLLDVSAVGNPKDGDLRSKWGQITWDKDTMSWTTRLHYVEYPLEETIQQIHDSGMPKPDKRVRILQKASYT